MIQAVEIRASGKEPLVAPVAVLFAEMGRAYCPRRTRADVACRNQFRTQLIWPVFEELITKHEAHRPVLARERDEHYPRRVRMTPMYLQPVGGRRRDAAIRKTPARFVDVAVLFVREGPRTELAYVYHNRDGALKLLTDQLKRRRRRFTIERLAIPAIAYEHTPPRVPIYHAGLGRVLPGPDVVADGAGATIEELLAGERAAPVTEEEVCP